jgi:tetratricopeptide (TPR) repeat protein
MDITLDTILENLQDNNNRLTFLGRAYTPGNSAIADHILAIGLDSSIIRQELAYAVEHGEEGRVVVMGQHLVDSRIASGHGSLLKDEVIGLGNNTVTDYAIEALGAEGREEDSLETAAELCDSLGDREEVRVSLLERVFNLQMERNGGEHPFSPAYTAEMLGRFDEAISLFKRSGYNWLDSALGIAKANVPGRVREIAEAGFNGFVSYDQLHRAELYLESARILGKEEEAKVKLEGIADNLAVVRGPNFYKGFVRALVSVGLEEEARGVVANCRSREVGIEQSETSLGSGDLRHLAELYRDIGDNESAVEIYLLKTDKDFASGTPSVNYMPDLNAALALNGGTKVLERKALIFERDGKYDQAAVMARHLGKAELAETYEAMHGMVGLI